MTTVEETICDKSFLVTPPLDDSKGLSALEFQIRDSLLDLWCKLDVDTVASRVLDEVHLLFEKIRKGERLHESPFADYSVRQGLMWNDSFVSQLIEESLIEGLNAELNFARERIANIPDRIVNEAILAVGLALEANGVWEIEGSGKEVCNHFMKEIADREAEEVADSCATSPGGWSPAIISKARLLYDLYKRVLREARRDYLKNANCWREYRRQLLKNYPEMAEVIDKIPVRQHFTVSELAFQVVSKRLRLRSSLSYVQKMIYGSEKSSNELVNDGSVDSASAVAAALQKSRTKILSFLS